MILRLVGLVMGHGVWIVFWVWWWVGLLMFWLGLVWVCEDGEGVPFGFDGLRVFLGTMESNSSSRVSCGMNV